MVSVGVCVRCDDHLCVPEVFDIVLGSERPHDPVEFLSAEHLYILDTPLFRVRGKSKKPIYCYSEEERDKAVKEIGRDAEITRFKGLGEINPEEFGQFIRGDSIRLQLVTVENARRLDNFVNFLMGPKNTPARKEFILQRLM